MSFDELSNYINVYTEILNFFQLYDKHELKKYDLWLNDLQKSTTSTLNAVAVALLNKVSPMQVEVINQNKLYQVQCF